MANTVFINPSFGIKVDYKTLRVGNKYIKFQTSAEKRKTVKLLKRGLTLAQALAWEGPLPDTKETKETKESKETKKEEIKEYFQLQEEDLLIQYWEGAIQENQLTEDIRHLLYQVENFPALWGLSSTKVKELLEGIESISYSLDIPHSYLREWTLERIQRAININRWAPSSFRIEDLEWMLEQEHYSWKECLEALDLEVYAYPKEVRPLFPSCSWVFREVEIIWVTWALHESQGDLVIMEELLYNAFLEGWDNPYDLREAYPLGADEYYFLKDSEVDVDYFVTFSEKEFLESYFGMIPLGLKFPLWGSFFGWKKYWLTKDKEVFCKNQYFKMKHWKELQDFVHEISYEFRTSEFWEFIHVSLKESGEVERVISEILEREETKLFRRLEAEDSSEWEELYKFCSVDMWKPYELPYLTTNKPKYEVKTSTEVIPYRGQVCIVCSRISMKEDPRWSNPESKIWAATRGYLPSYGDYANLVFVQTHKGKKTEYRIGAYYSQWEEPQLWGVDPYYENIGAICYENSLTSEKIDLGRPNDLPNINEEGWIRDAKGRKGWLTTNNGPWTIVFEDGEKVSGERGTPEVIAYLKGKVKTEAEEGLPLKALFAVRLVMIAMGVVKGFGKDPRSAGYRWLGHYALGTGRDLKMPGEWVNPYLTQMLDKADEKGRIVWQSSDWQGVGFNERPHGFYTVGGFIGYLKEGVFSFEDYYDWHPMPRTSSKGLGDAKLWCWSEIKNCKLEEIIPKAIHPLMNRVLKGYRNLTFLQFLEEKLGSQYFGYSDFFGISGVSNKLWHDLQFVGAKSFKTTYKQKVR